VLHGPIRMQVTVERWELARPFHISNFVFETIEPVVVSLECDGSVGRGEAIGTYYTGDTGRVLADQIEARRGAIEASGSRQTLRTLLPTGGARSAVDCALWDLEARLSGRPAWETAGLAAPTPLLTTFTCGIDTPERMAQVACGYATAKAVKLKLSGDPIDAARVLAVRAARPDVWLGVDANQGHSPDSLRELMPTLIEAQVQLIEQPFPVGQEHLIDRVKSPIRIAADESILALDDLLALSRHFQAVNIKLDKCGGLTEALEMARTARRLGLEVMVGNMMGTSLAMAPSALVGQLCSIVDLDGPIFLKADREPSVRYEDGRIQIPPGLWGGL